MPRTPAEAAVRDENSGSIWYGDPHVSYSVAALLVDATAQAQARLVRSVSVTTRSRPERAWVSQRQAARIAGVSERKIRAAVRAGELPAAQPGLRTKRIERDSLDVWLRSLRPTRGRH